MAQLSPMIGFPSKHQGFLPHHYSAIRVTNHQIEIRAIKNCPHDGLTCGINKLRFMEPRNCTLGQLRSCGEEPLSAMFPGPKNVGLLLCTNNHGVYVPSDRPGAGLDSCPVSYPNGYRSDVIWRYGISAWTASWKPEDYGSTRLNC